MEHFFLDFQALFILPCFHIAFMSILLVMA